MNAYLAKKKAETNTIQLAVQQTYTQYMMDMISLTLNDPGGHGKGHVRV